MTVKYLLPWYVFDRQMAETLSPLFMALASGVASDPKAFIGIVLVYAIPANVLFSPMISLTYSTPFLSIKVEADSTVTPLSATSSAAAGMVNVMDTIKDTRIMIANFFMIEILPMKSAG